MPTGLSWSLVAPSPVPVQHVEEVSGRRSPDGPFPAEHVGKALTCRSSSARSVPTSAKSASTEAAPRVPKPRVPSARRTRHPQPARRRPASTRWRTQYSPMYSAIVSTSPFLSSPPGDPEAPHGASWSSVWAVAVTCSVRQSHGRDRRLGIRRISGREPCRERIQQDAVQLGQPLRPEPLTQEVAYDVMQCHTAGVPAGARTPAPSRQAGAHCVDCKRSSPAVACHRSATRSTGTVSFSAKTASSLNRSVSAASSSSVLALIVARTDSARFSGSSRSTLSYIWMIVGDHRAAGPQPAEQVPAGF